MYNLVLKNSKFDFFRDAERQRVNRTYFVCVEAVLFKSFIRSWRREVLLSD